MIYLEEACRIATEKFKQKGYFNGIVNIVDIGDRWILFSTMFGKSELIEYGNCPYAVNKENGEYMEFPLSVMENFDLYYSGEIVEVPEEYRLTI